MTHEQFMLARWKKAGLDAKAIEKRLRWRAQNRKQYAKHKEKIRARQRARYAANPDHFVAIVRNSRRRLGERFREQNTARQRRYRAKTWKAWYAIPENRAKVLAWTRRWYWENGGKQYRRENRIGWSCDGGCGRNTKHPTGRCQPCRTTRCRTCSKPMIRQQLVQRLHARCVPKGSEYMGEAI